MLLRPGNDYGMLRQRDVRPLWRRYLWWWLLPLLAFDLWLIHRLWPRRAAEPPPPPPVEEAPALLDARSGTPAARWKLTFPTPQIRLLDAPDATIFMPTASGLLESALYGSTRTGGQGGGLPSFHEGVDIAPTQRDRKGRPTDTVFAVGDGRVAYLNRHAGNSNYGIYVVLLHDDPIGEIYTLYAHLASIVTDLRAGQAVAAGAPIGVMGNTPASIIPLSRAHLHFEIGLVQNRRFAQWYRAQQKTPDHGNLHGANLFGVNPLAAFAARDADGTFSMAELLAVLPTAFELTLRAPRLPDYFTRYPGLWRGDPFAGAPITLGVSDGGVVLYGRTATAEESDRLGAAAWRVAFVDPDVLGRNGRRLVIPRQSEWTLGAHGREWLDILLF